MYRIPGTPRPSWAELPGAVRDRVVAMAGSPVADAVTVTTGFSNGFAGTLMLAGGARVFVKAISDRMNVVGARLYRDEVRVLQRMPRAAPVPALLAWCDDHIAGQRAASSRRALRGTVGRTERRFWRCRVDPG